jgi:hypothetical protein
MTFEQFMTIWNGKYCEVAGTPNARNQCVDVVNAYIRDVLGLPIIEWTNAVDFPSKAGDKYTYTANTPTNIPMRGDIIVWNGAIGHIAIVIEANVNNFKSFDQNYPVGSPCHVQGHNYNNVKGWLRAKQQPQVVTVPATQPIITDQTRIPQLGDMEVQQIRSKLNDLERDLKSLREHIEEYKKLHPEESMKKDEAVELTTITYPVSPKYTDKTAEQLFSGPFMDYIVNPIQDFFKKYWK